MINQQGAHLPPVTHLFDHYASNRLAIPVGGCAFEQMPLLLHAGELGVALIDNQINQSVAHLLRRHLAQVLPFAAPLKGAELDFLGFDRAIEGVELEAGDFVAIDADLLAPVVKHPNPITKRSDFGNLTWHKIRSLLVILRRYAFRRRRIWARRPNARVLFARATTRAPGALPYRFNQTVFNSV